MTGTLGLWLPGPRLDLQQARWFAALPLAGRYLGYTHALAQDSRGRLTDLSALGQALGLPVVAVGDVHYHVRDRRRLHDVLTAVRLKTTVAQIGRAGRPNGEHHLRPLATLRKLYPPELLAATVGIADRCTFSLAALHYEYPEELVPIGLTASEHLRALTEEGMRQRWPHGVSAAIREQIERELVLIREMRFEHFFLTVPISSALPGRRASCARAGAAPPTLRCATALHVTEVDPTRVSMLFERFISRERHEAAGHRRGLRAPAARRGHPVHLHQVRPPPGRAGRHRGDLSTAPGGARCGQGAGVAGATRRCPGEIAALVRWQRRTAGQLPELGFDPRIAHRAAVARAGQAADGLSPASVPARRRLRHHSDAALARWCRWKTPPCPSAPSSSGTRRTWRRWGY